MILHLAKELYHKEQQNINIVMLMLVVIEALCSLAVRRTHVLFAAGIHSVDYGPTLVNSLAPGRFECDYKNVIFNLALLTGNFTFSYDNVLRWMPQDLTDD